MAMQHLHVELVRPPFAIASGARRVTAVRDGTFACAVGFLVVHDVLLELFDDLPSTGRGRAIWPAERLGASSLTLFLSEACDKFKLDLLIAAIR
jgi:hypothetical protein